MDYYDFKSYYILGNGIDEAINFQYAIVVQGPIYVSQTAQILQYYFDNSTFDTIIILSTYEHEFKREEFDQFLDKGRFVTVLSTPPSAAELPEFYDINIQNRNYQRFTSYLGISLAKYLGCTFAMKTRTDCLIGLPNFCNYLHDKFYSDDSYNIIAFEGENKQKGRITVSSQRTRRDISVGQFHIRDMWYFGYTSDLCNLFNLYSRSWAYGKGNNAKCAAEHDMISPWYRDMNIRAKDIFELVGRYFIIIDPTSIHFMFKYCPVGHYLDARNKGIAELYVTDSWERMSYTDDSNITHSLWNKIHTFHRNIVENISVDVFKIIPKRPQTIEERITPQLSSHIKAIVDFNKHTSQYARFSKFNQDVPMNIATFLMNYLELDVLLICKGSPRNLTDDEGLGTRIRNSILLLVLPDGTYVEKYPETFNYYDDYMITKKYGEQLETRYSNFLATYPIEDTNPPVSDIITKDTIRRAIVTFNMLPLMMTGI